MLGRIQHAQPDGLHQYGSLMTAQYVLGDRCQQVAELNMS